MADTNLTIIEEITPVEEIVDENIDAEEFDEDNTMILEMGGVEINSLDFVPTIGEFIYSDNTAKFTGEFKYSTVRKPDEMLTASGSISLGIQGGEGVTVATDENNSSVKIGLDEGFIKSVVDLTDYYTKSESDSITDELQREILKVDGILAETNYEVKQNAADIESLEMKNADINEYVEDLQTRTKSLEDFGLTTNTPQVIKKEGSKIFEGGIGLSSEDGADTIQINNYGPAISFLGPDGRNILYLDRSKQTASAFGKQLATLDDITESQGTKVTVGGEVKATFNADTKADKAEIQNFVEMKKTEGADTAMITNYGRTVSMGVQNQNSGSILGLSSNSLQLSISEGDKESSIQMLPSHVEIDTEDLTWNGETLATKLVNDLENYYLKTQTYTKEEINQLVGTGSSLHFKVVTSLPIENISTSTIYLVAKPVQTENNIYDEYIYVSNKWELIGSTAIDLTDYYTKEEIDKINLDLSSQIEQVSNEIAFESKRIDKNEGSIESIKTDIDTIQSNVDIVETSIDTIKTSVDKLTEATQDLKDSANANFKLIADNLDSLQVSKQDTLKAGENINIQDNIIDAHIAIDSELSTDSKNPVQNRVITKSLKDIEQNIVNANEKFGDYLPLTGGIVTGNIISTADITAQTAAFGAAKLMGSVTAQEEDYVVVTDTAGNMHKRVMNKVLDDIGGSTILNGGIRQSTFDVKTLQDQITENTDDIATNIADIASLQASKQNTLTAGANITIDKNNVISSTGGSDIIVDIALSETSENPVQNKVISSELNKKANNNDVVKLTGNQVIGGRKVFWDAAFASSGFTISGALDEIVPIQTGITSTSSGTFNTAYFQCLDGISALKGKYDRPQYVKVIDSQHVEVNDIAFTSDLPSTEDFASKSELSNYLPLSGGSISGPLNFANNTWNLMGDDAYIGDCNEGGCIGIKGANNKTGIAFMTQQGSEIGKITYDGVTFDVSGFLSTYGVIDFGDGQGCVDLPNNCRIVFGHIDSVNRDSTTNVTFYNNHTFASNPLIITTSLGDKRNSTQFTNGVSIQSSSTTGFVLRTDDYNFGRNYLAIGRRP